MGESTCHEMVLNYGPRLVHIAWDKDLLHNKVEQFCQGTRTIPVTEKASIQWSIQDFIKEGPNFHGAQGTTTKD